MEKKNIFTGEKYDIIWIVHFNNYIPNKENCDEWIIGVKNWFFAPSLFSAILLSGEIGGLIDNRQIFSFIRGESARLLDLIDFREENAPSLLWNLDSVTF